MEELDETEQKLELQREMIKMMLVNMMKAMHQQVELNIGEKVKFDKTTLGIKPDLQVLEDGSEFTSESSLSVRNPAGSEKIHEIGRGL